MRGVPALRRFESRRTIMNSLLHVCLAGILFIFLPLNMVAGQSLSVDGCLGNRYTCNKTRQCVDYAALCDFYDDCGDGSDEYPCEYSAVCRYEYNIFQAIRSNCLQEAWTKVAELIDGYASFPIEDREGLITNIKFIPSENPVFQALGFYRFKIGSDLYNDAVTINYLLQREGVSADLTVLTLRDPLPLHLISGSTVNVTVDFTSNVSRPDSLTRLKGIGRLELTTSKVHNCSNASPECLAYVRVSRYSYGGCFRSYDDGFYLLLTECPVPSVCPDGELTCSSGICLPDRYACDGFSDCGDWSDENFCYSDEYFYCQELNFSPPVCNIESFQIIRSNSQVSHQFDIPDVDSYFLREVNVTVLQADVGCTTYRINITRQLSNGNITVLRQYCLSPEAEPDGLLFVQLREPVPVLPREIVTVTIETTISAVIVPLQLASVRDNIVSVGLLKMKTSCNEISDVCLSQIFDSAQYLMTVPDRCYGKQLANFYLDLYAHCGEPPSITKISPNMTVREQSTFSLECISDGIPIPSMQWIGGDSSQFPPPLLGNALIGQVFNFKPSSSVTSFTCRSQNIFGEVNQTVIIDLLSPACSEILSNISSTQNALETNCLEENPMSVPFTRTGLQSFQGFLNVVGSYILSRVNLTAESLGVSVRSQLRYHVVNFRLEIRSRGTLVYFRRFSNYILDAFEDLSLLILPPLPVNETALTISVYIDDLPESSSNVDGAPRVRVQLLDFEAKGGEVCIELLSDAMDDLGDNCFIAPDLSDEVVQVRRYFQILQRGIGVFFMEPRIIDRLQESQEVSPNSEEEVQVLCLTWNALNVVWYIKEWYGYQLTEYTGNVLNFFPSYDFRQGQYYCVAEGYLNTTVMSTPVALVSADDRTYLVTANFLNLGYTEALSDPNSKEYSSHAMRLSNFYLEEVRIPLGSGISYSASIEEMRAARIGVIADTRIRISKNPAGPFKRAVPETMLIPQLLSAISEGQNRSLLNIDVNTLQVQALTFCAMEVVATSSGNLTFPETAIAAVARSIETCGTHTTNAGDPRATRRCEGDFTVAASWTEPILQPCYPETDDGELSLERLSMVVQEQPVTMDNVEVISRDLADITSLLSEGTYNLDSEVVLNDVAVILEAIDEVGSPSPEVTRNVVETVNNILNLDNQQFMSGIPENSPARILKSFERQLTNLQGGGQNFTEYLPNVGVSALRVDKTSLQMGITFANLISSQADIAGTIDLNDSVITATIDFKTDRVIRAAVELPPAVFNVVPQAKQADIPLTLVIYRQGHLFVTSTDEILESSVISATLEGYEVSGLPPESPVVTKFTPKKVPGVMQSSPRTCVFWDFALNEGVGAWSDEGCELVLNAYEDGGIHECHCNHLTNFAVLIDFQGSLDSRFLDILSTIGLIVSIVALTIVVVTFLCSKNLRSKRPQRILINLCVALLGLYIAFLIGINRTNLGAGCVIFGALIHFFCLSSLAWMCVEATNMYLLFVKVWDNQVSNFMFKASFVAWVAPAVLVVLMAVVNPMHYDNGEYCFPYYNTYTFYVCVVALVGLMLLYNIVIFILVIRQLTCARVSASNKENNWGETMRRFQNAVAISVLLGLTWIFGFLSVTGAQFITNLLFLIFNSLQGLFVFLLFALRQKDVRDVWKDWLKCECFQKERKSAYYKGTNSLASENKIKMKGVSGTTNSTGDTLNSSSGLNSGFEPSV